MTTQAKQWQFSVRALFTTTAACGLLAAVLRHVHQGLAALVVFVGGLGLAMALGFAVLVVLVERPLRRSRHMDRAGPSTRPAWRRSIVGKFADFCAVFLPIVLPVAFVPVALPLTRQFIDGNSAGGWFSALAGYWLAAVLASATATLSAERLPDGGLPLNILRTWLPVCGVVFGIVAACLTFVAALTTLVIGLLGWLA